MTRIYYKASIFLHWRVFYKNFTPVQWAHWCLNWQAHIPIQDQTSYLAVPEAWGNFSVLCQTSAGICLTDLTWEGISFPPNFSHGIQKNLIHLASQLGKQVNTNHAMCRASLIMSQNVKKCVSPNFKSKLSWRDLRFQPAEIWWHQWWLLWRQTPLSRCQTNPTLWFARKEWQDPEKCKYQSRIPSKPFSAIKSMYSVLKSHLNNKLGQLWLWPEIGEHIVPDVPSLLQRQAARRPGGQWFTWFV